MTLKTTTWRDRNIDNLELTRKSAEERGITRPVIYNFGPGGSVRFMAGRLPQGRTADLHRRDRFIRVFESLLRKSGLFGLTTTEPLEIARIFSGTKPREIMVFDREIKVIRAVRKIAEEMPGDIPVNAVLMDMQKETVSKPADIVIALNIVSRNRDRNTILQNIAAATRPGGLICINIDDPPNTEFRKIGHCLFERI